MKKFIFEIQLFATLNNSLTGASITNSAREDYISNSGNFTNILLGSGAETVENTGDFVTLISGAGNDIITNRGGDSVIIAASGKNSVWNVGHRVAITTGSGDDSITNGDSYLVGNSVQYEKADSVTLNAGDGNNYIYNYSNNTEITTGSGNDYCYIKSSRYVTVDSGAGNDTIGLNGYEGYNVQGVIINSGAGDDEIELGIYVDSITISGGKGNDLISFPFNSYGNNFFIQYTYGDGNDTITNFGANDTLQIATNTDYTTVQSGSNIYFRFDNGEILTVQKIGYKVNVETIPAPEIIPVTSEPETVEPVTSEPETVEPVTSEPETVEPVTVEPETVEPVTVEPETVEPVTSEPETVEPVTLEPVTVVVTCPPVTLPAGSDEPVTVEPATVEPETVEPATSEPATVNVNVTNITNVTNINNTTVISNYFDFRTTAFYGGNQIISDYTSGEKINYSADFKGINFTETDFMINSGTGSLIIQNARDKVMDVAVDGNTVAYAFMASGGGEIDGSSFSPLEVILGANNSDNQISAGSGGSSLWGGVGGNDTLTGGAGVDNFFFGKADGADKIFNAGSSDVVNLYDVTLADILTADISGQVITANLTSGGSLQINSAENLSAVIKLADGNYQFNHSSGTWQTA